MSFLYNQFSVVLFLITYFNLGWLLAADRAAFRSWLVVIVLILLLAEALASPWALIRKFILRWLSTDIKAFVVVAMGAFITVVFLSWLHVFTQVLLLVTSASLTRLNLQTSGISDKKAFVILSGLSLVCVGAGGGVNWLFRNGDLVMQLVMGNR